MILKTSNIRFTGPGEKLCATAMFLSLLAGTDFGFPRFGWRAVGHKPAHQAAIRGDAARLAEEIRDNPAHASSVDAKGNTPLHLSGVHDSADVARLLLGAGAEVNARNAQGMTPLIVAAKSGSLEVVKLLLKHGADPMIKDAHGWSALKWAKRSRHYEIAMRIALAGVRH